MKAMRPRAGLKVIGPCAVLAMSALLLLGGCGGGSSSSQGESSTEASTDVAATGNTPATSDPTKQSGSASSEHASAGQVSDSSSKGAGEGTEGSEGSRGGSGGHAGKHGPHIVVPKGEREPTITPEDQQQATVANMTLRSPVIQSAGTSQLEALPTRYTCDGEDSWPQLTWAGVPQGTAELALYAMSVQPVQGELFVDWAVAGISPGEDGIEAGHLPKGSIVGTNGFGKRGYSICPPGKEETYMFAVYALPKSLSLQPGFDASQTRRQVLNVSGNVGLLPVAYARP